MPICTWQCNSQKTKQVYNYIKVPSCVVWCIVHKLVLESVCRPCQHLCCSGFCVFFSPCVVSNSLCGAFSVIAEVILTTRILSLGWIYWQHAPSLPGQLFNYPGLLIVPGTRHSGTEAGPAPVNDWLFHGGPLGAGRQHRDGRAPRTPGLFCSAVAFTFFISSLDCKMDLK